MSRLKERYNTKVREALTSKYSYKNVMTVPRLEKIVVSMGVAEATKDRNVMGDHQKELAMITGQKPLVTKARLSISNFKLREGQEVGMKVTLRRKRMFDFLDRFINIASPRIHDFRGFKGGFDGSGNYSVGLTAQDVFPELNLDDVKRTQGMNITFVTTANSNEECKELLKGLGMPLVDK